MLAAIRCVLLSLKASPSAAIYSTLYMAVIANIATLYNTGQ